MTSLPSLPPPSATVFASSARVRISDLTPDLASTTSAYIDAQVALLWPYSSSTQKISLLLAETDVQPHKLRRQVKVTFYNGAARATQESRVGVGDRVKLLVSGCKWMQTADVVSTPGKKIDWDIEFRNGVTLLIDGDGVPPKLVEYTFTGPPLTATNGILHNETPKRTILDRTASQISVPYHTPPRLPNKLSAHSFLEASLDPFSDDDGYVVGKGRKRTKFGRHSGSWNLVDVEHDEELIIYEHHKTDNKDESAPSFPDGNLQPSKPGTVHIDLTSPSIEAFDGPSPFPFKQAVPNPIPSQFESAQSRPSPQKSDARPPVPVLMPPPLTPLRPARQKAMHIDLSRNTELDEAASAKTPRLLPLASPGLPLVSPLIKHPGIQTGYFPARDSQTSELDELAQSSPAVRGIISVSGSERDSHTDVSDESLIVIGEMTPSRSERMQSSGQDLLEIGVNIQGRAAERGGVPYNGDLHITSPDSLREPPSAVSSTFSEKFGIVGDMSEGLDENPVLRHQSMPYEIEDDDMYGPPIVAEPSTTQVGTQVPHDRSALDILEEFLQMSPVATTFGSAAPDAPSVQPSSLPAEVLSDETNWQGKIDIQAVECDADRQYPPPPFPFQRNWHRRGSRASGRRSSTHSTRSYNYDGTTDGPASKVPDFSAEAAKVQAVYSSESSSVVSESSQQTSESEDGKFPALTNKQTGHGVEFSAENVKSDENDIAGSRSLEKAESSRIDSGWRESGRLPITPAQTQEDLETTTNAPDPIEASEILPPSMPTPMPTQDGLEQMLPSVLSPNQAQSSAFAQTEPQSRPVTDAASSIALRVSRRLSRRSLPAENMTSPYFTPHRQTRAKMPGLISEKENLPPWSPPLDVSSPPRRSSRRLSTVADTQAVLSANKISPKQHRVATSEDLSTTDIDEDFGFLRSLRKGTTTPLAYYPHLASLRDYFGNLVDVIALCSEDSKGPEKAAKGPKHHYSKLRIVDPSFTTRRQSATLVQVFRPNRLSLPKAARGDVVILRNFKVHTLKHKWTLLSCDSSAWAVLSVGSNLIPDWETISIDGPPLEHGEGELSYAETLLQWWNSEGQQQYPEIGWKDDEPAVPKSPSTEGAKLVAVPRENARPNTRAAVRARREQNETDHIDNEDDDASLVNDDESVDLKPPLATKTPRHSKRSSIPGTAAKTTESVRRRSRRSESVVHELRDGTTYVDDDADRMRAGRCGP